MSSKKLFKDSTVLITGGTGSFGRMTAKQLLTEYQCKKVIIFSRDEWKQWEMKSSDPIYNHPSIRYFLGDVRDLQRLTRAFSEVDYVIHTAALKQVPAAEYNPTEFVKTNVLGAMNVIEAAINCGVRQVIALSTDKACYPVNLYGATKLCSDKLFVNGNVYVGNRGFPIFSVVRYGNVIGSRGSIIPYWLSSVREGAKYLTVTDERMTRFWITIEEAVDFVLGCFSMSRGGEIFVPKIPGMKIMDLAKAIAPDLPIKISGIREGEKLHEMMISQEDARIGREYENHYIIIPEAYSQDSKKLKEYLKNRAGKELPDGFSYQSDTNPNQLTQSDLKKYLRKYL